jgi:hypothetical protein
LCFSQIRPASLGESPRTIGGANHIDDIYMSHGFFDVMPSILNRGERFYDPLSVYAALLLNPLDVVGEDVEVKETDAVLVYRAIQRYGTAAAS